jgi:hypothetical protein
MIWFTCKQCGKQMGRPDETAGSLVFCACGQGNRVPWESTVPVLERADGDSEPPAPDRPRPAWPAPRRRPAVRRRDPGRCLNHEDIPATQACAACGESFCASCVVTLQGQTLCGPCKNLRVHEVDRPPRLSMMALAALLLGLASGPAAFCLSMVPLSMPQGPGPAAVVFALVGALLPGAALVVGLLALRDIERNPQIGGRALAMTGTVSAVLGLLWSLAMVVILIGRRMME